MTQVHHGPSHRGGRRDSASSLAYAADRDTEQHCRGKARTSAGYHAPTARQLTPPCSAVGTAWQNQKLLLLCTEPKCHSWINQTHPFVTPSTSLHGVGCQRVVVLTAVLAFLSSSSSLQHQVIATVGWSPHFDYWLPFECDLVLAVADGKRLVQPSWAQRVQSGQHGNRSPIVSVFSNCHTPFRADMVKVRALHRLSVCSCPFAASQQVALQVLQQHIGVDNLGSCLHNSPFPIPQPPGMTNRTHKVVPRV